MFGAIVEERAQKSHQQLSTGNCCDLRTEIYVRFLESHSQRATELPLESLTLTPSWETLSQNQNVSVT